MQKDTLKLLFLLVEKKQWAKIVNYYETVD